MLELRGEMGTVDYRLFGIVYYNGSHFIGAWTNEDGSCWGYDGLAHGGSPERLRSANLGMLREYNGYQVHIVVYSLCGSTPSSEDNFRELQGVAAS